MTVKVSGEKIKPLYEGKMCERQAKTAQTSAADRYCL